LSGKSAEHSSLKQHHGQKRAPKHSSHTQLPKTAPKNSSQKQLPKTAPKNSSQKQLPKTAPKNSYQKKPPKTSYSHRKKKLHRAVSRHDTDEFASVHAIAILIYTFEYYKTVQKQCTCRSKLVLHSGVMPVFLAMKQIKKHHPQEFIAFIILQHLFTYRVFSHDVMAAILVFQNNETAAMLVDQTNPVGVESFSYVSTFFCSNKFAWLLVT